MKSILFFPIQLLFASILHGQVLTVENLCGIISFPTTRFENQLYGKGFALTGKTMEKDTYVRMYDYRRTKHVKEIDSISRSITRADKKNDAYITYETASLPEFTEMKTQLKNEGFFCNQPEKVDNQSSLLFQHKDLSVRTFIKTETGKCRYSLQFHKKIFPKAKDIFYADDLLTFTSHEYLVYYFGEKNVQKDLYILAGNKTVPCSVLFLNTNRQVVFIWSDEENLCNINSLLFGGQLKLKSSLESGKYVEENNWALKTGLRAGMTMLELRMRNGNDFRFHGGKSVNRGLVIPGNNDKIDFDKEKIILGCLNCSDDKFTTASVIHADDAIDEGRILFVLSVMLTPY